VLSLFLLAQAAAPTLDTDLFALAKTVLAAVTSGNLWLGVAGAFFLADAALVRYGGTRWPILKHPAMRLVLICAGAFLGGLMNSFAAGLAPGAAVFLAAAKIAGAAFVASGGWALVQKYVMPFVLAKLGVAGKTPEARTAEGDAAAGAAAGEIKTLADAKAKLDLK
jgi:hypothetical protein